MATERLVKWSENSKKFFETAEDNSITLDVMISYACESQTGEGFEELINTINSKNIKRKIKKVNMTDTSYLYRHDNCEFAKYADVSIPTEWFLKNKEAIDKLKVPKEVKSWATDINTSEFQKWDKKIRLAFAGDENGLNINKEFRDQVLQEAKIWTIKSGAELRQSLNFILEECAHSCAFLNHAIIAYPGKPTLSLTKAMQINGAHFVALDYKISDHAQRQRKYRSQKSISFDSIDKEIALFLKEKVSNVNFFVIDKNGNPIYINYALEKMANRTNIKSFDQKNWKNFVQVMIDRKESIVEEISPSWKRYLSVKSPLIIDDKVEGVIGLAVDITERKKIEALEQKLKIEEELYTVAREVAHDIASPLSSLKAIEYIYKEKLGEPDMKMLQLAISSIENMSKKLLEKYRAAKNLEEGVEEKNEGYREEEKIELNKTLEEIIESKKYENEYKYKEVEINIKYTPDEENKEVYIKGDRGDFSRMMSNTINNGVEALEEKGGNIEIMYKVEGEKVKIIVKDNGKGIPADIVEKIARGEEVGTTKRYGHGIGTEQIQRVIKEMKGHLAIKSKENEGSEFIITFPKDLSPSYV
ncbi:MAG: GHKL domain-containing protein [Endomicrobium sp.]|jgi:signal transduction histidine kinase|nr:GHKL domain-containing protein [Endomicrobium sp.]